MSRDGLYNYHTLRLGKYLDEHENAYEELETAKAFAVAFGISVKLEVFDEKNLWFAILVGYDADSIFAPEILSTIKFFALYYQYSILGQYQEVRSVYDELEPEGC